MSVTVLLHWQASQMKTALLYTKWPHQLGPLNQNVTAARLADTDGIETCPVSHLQTKVSQSLPSTMNNLRIAVMNANSVKGKRAEIAELCNSTQPDILVFGSHQNQTR